MDARGLACRELLGAIASASVRFRPRSPEELDACLRLARLWPDLPEADRATLQEALEPRTRAKLLVLSAFLAEWAVSARSAEHLRAATVLHVLEGFGRDPRESVRHLVLLHHAARHLGHDLGDLVRAVLPLAPRRAVPHLREFVDRSESVKRLASYGMRESWVDGRFRFAHLSRPDA